MLKADHLSYATSRDHRLKEICLAIPSGQVHGLLGPNGAGKSTLLKVLAGLLSPTSGIVYWQERPLHAKSREEISRIITLVPQDLHVTFEFTVEEIIAMGRYKRRISADEIMHYLELVSATHLAHRLITELSQGEKQMIFLARALASECQVLLLDEPTNALDIHHQQKIWNVLTRISELGKTVIVTTHDFFAAEKYCKSITLMDCGSIVATGSYQEIMTREYIQKVFRMDHHTNEYL